MNDSTISNSILARALRQARRAAWPLLGVSLLVGTGAITLTASLAQAGVDTTVEQSRALLSVPASFADLVDATRPSVVAIMTRSKVVDAGPGIEVPSQLPQGHPLRRFFEREPRRAMRGIGSGFIVDSSGFIVTNNHVIDGADEIAVVLHDGTELAARVHGRDTRTDLALLKVDSGQDLVAARFGDSDKARVGDWVVAVGSPFGLGGTYTAGIISARGRDIRSGPYDDFLQVDASINRGNSGGALFNTAGEVVGVNTAIFSPNGGSVGIGFAVPAKLAKAVINDLKDDGLVQRGWLGVQIQDVTAELAQALRLKSADGALVAEVTADSPAARAGLRPGDVVTAVANNAVGQVRDLSSLVAATRAGTAVKLSVWRDGTQITVNATIGSLPGERVANAPSVDVGLAVASLDATARQRFGVADGLQGVVITDVRNGSSAQKLGLRPGFIIEMIANKRVSAPADVAASIARARANNNASVLMLVTTPQGQRRFLALAVG